uniref:CSON007105 protein n=1 Tax=Culicoides sonorensis TaxID=179676 RepID=A0A336L9M3_CULSO
MDYIFDIFYEEIFETMERNGLQTRQCRRDVIDRLNSVISGCIRGQNLSADECSRQAVLSAIEYHQRHKEENGNVCLMGKYHNILYVTIRVAWDWGVTDSEVVTSLLRVIFGTNAPYFISGWRSDFKDQDENTRAMVYFLHHAANTQLEFPVFVEKCNCVKMIKFIDIPIESCGRASPLRVTLQASAPDILLILLRHGASPNPFDDGIPPVIALFDKLIEYQDRRYPYQLDSCLRLLLRTLSFIELPFKPLIYEARKEMFIEKYEVLLEDKLIQPNRVFGVPELKHLSRCKIREELNKNCQLPRGIKQLKIPGKLRRYIDLMEE